MEPNVEQSGKNPEEMTVDADQSQVDINPEEAGVLTKLPREDNPQEQWQATLAQIYAFLKQLPGPVVDFYNNYSQAILIAGIVFGTFVGVKVLFAALGALNEIPLVAPTFELVGIFYTAWLLFRYLPTAEKRKEFKKDFESLKDQVFGDEESADS